MVNVFEFLFDVVCFKSLFNEFYCFLKIGRFYFGKKLCGIGKYDWIIGFCGCFIKNFCSMFWVYSFKFFKKNWKFFFLLIFFVVDK